MAWCRPYRQFLGGDADIPQYDFTRAEHIEIMMSMGVTLEASDFSYLMGYYIRKQLETHFWTLADAVTKLPVIRISDSKLNELRNACNSQLSTYAPELQSRAIILTDLCEYRQDVYHTGCNHVHVEYYPGMDTEASPIFKDDTMICLPADIPL